MTRSKTMTPAEYQVLASRTECDQKAASRRHYYNDTPECGAAQPFATRLMHALIGLTGEVGEIAASVEHWIYYGQKLDRVNLEEELGDALWYIALACNTLGLTIQGIMDSNIAKLRKRYPEKYSDEQAAEENRDRVAEREALETPCVGGCGDRATSQEFEQLDSPVEVKADNEGIMITSVDLPLSDSYPFRCRKCQRPIHKNRATSMLCPDCLQEVLAQRSVSTSEV
jgi:NTP pyrophosphatase (non-canonical NTP hydrolase)